MFLLPNQNKIDEDGVIEAMLHRDTSRRYFLDTTTGEVGCVEKKTKKDVLPSTLNALGSAQGSGLTCHRV